MPLGVRLKKSFDAKPKLSSGRVKETAGSISLVDRWKHRSRGYERGHRREPESDDNDSDGEPYGRARSRNHRADSHDRPKYRSRGYERGQRREPELDDDDSDGEPYGRARSRNHRADSHDRSKHRNRGNERGHRRESESDDIYFDGEPHGKARIRDRRANSHAEGRDHRFIREENGVEAGTKGSFDSKKRKRAYDARDAGGNEKSLGFRVSNRKSSFTEENIAHKDATISMDGKHKKVGLSGRKPSHGMRRNFVEKDFDMERSNGEACELRSNRQKKDDNSGSRYSHRNERRNVGFKAPSDRLVLKGKKRNGMISSEDCKGDSELRLLEKRAIAKDKSDQVAAKNLDKQQTYLPDKSGKKVENRKKYSDDVPADTDAPPKKRKRIRIDPYDVSNKRLDDAVPNDEKADKDIEKEITVSKNAQFRSIQPSPSILSFVEDNLLGRRRLIELQKAGYNVKLSVPLDNVPFSTSTERERIEENVFRNKLEFFAAAKISSSFPPPMIPEIAFAGRSNVGKSSLLNSLTRQWGVVRTSDKPGLTQTINFFRLASKLCLVDLPGYGFAYAKEEVKDAWEELVKEYVSTRVGLQRVCLLIDTKWGMKPRDHELIDIMERSQTPYQIVLTKTDVVFPVDVARRAMQIQQNLKANKSVVNPVMMVSSKSGAGIHSLRAVLAKLTRFVKP